VSDGERLDQSTALQRELSPLVSRMCCGDRLALRGIIDLTHPMLRRVACKLLKDPLDVEEVISDAYGHAWQKADRYEAARGTVAGWLAVICRNRAIDRLRAQSRLSPLSVCAREPDEAAHRFEKGPEHDLYSAQFRRDIGQALERLSPLRRQLLTLAFFEEFSHVEIATSNSLPLGTVKSHIRRALADLRRYLDQKSEWAVNTRGID
jgi:RNA polymerase sigma-70 factor (ECF subfamily)